MSASVRDLLDGAYTAAQSMRYVAPDSRATCHAVGTHVVDGVVVGLTHCVLVGRHEAHEMRGPE